MSSKRQEFVQNCWIVPNLEEAMERWIAMGVGPFFRRDSDYPDAIYRGTVTPLSFRGALAQAGPIQIELIQPTSTGPSAYRDVVPEGQSGFHHMCRIVDDVPAEMEAFRQRGIEIANEFRSVGGAPVAYADTRSEIGCMLELVTSAPMLMQLFQNIADAARDWDGSDPVRMLNSVN